MGRWLLPLSLALETANKNARTPYKLLDYANQLEPPCSTPSLARSHLLSPPLDNGLNGLNGDCAGFKLLLRTSRSTVGVLDRKLGGARGDEGERITSFCSSKGRGVGWFSEEEAGEGGRERTALPSSSSNLRLSAFTIETTPTPLL